MDDRLLIETLFSFDRAACTRASGRRAINTTVGIFLWLPQQRKVEYAHSYNHISRAGIADSYGSVCIVYTEAPLRRLLLSFLPYRTADSTTHQAHDCTSNRILHNTDQQPRRPLHHFDYANEEGTARLVQ